MSATTTPDTASAKVAPVDPGARRTIGFLNWAHATDHFVLLIYPTVVIGMVGVYGRSYSEMIALSTAAFVAFGVFSIPAGWLADRWSRRDMMAAFYLGCGAGLAVTAIAPNLVVLATALFAVGVFAAIYHPVGMAMLIDLSDARGRTLAFNGVCGNVGAASAAGISAALASWLGWRMAFLIPAAICIAAGFTFLTLVQDDRHRIGKRETVAKVPLSQRATVWMFGTYIVISLCSGLTFNTALVAVPKLFDERLGSSVSLVEVGGLATAVFLCGAGAQIAVGRLVEVFSPTVMLVIVACLQFASIIWAGHADGITLVAALAATMAAIYAQVTLGDIVLARFTADAWRARIYSVRYFLTFISAGIAVPMLAALHADGGFGPVLTALAAIAGALAAAVITFALIVSGAEARARAAQPAE